MKEAPAYHVILFKSVNQTMWADKKLKENGIPYKLIPVPRTISSDCGVCIRIESRLVGTVRSVVESIDGFVDIVPI
jgi:hypothetical protein